MIQSKTREIIKALMGFVKIAISTINIELMRPHVHDLLNAFSEWPSENKSRFKRRVRIIFTILVKKFGFDFIRNVTPASDVRLVEYLRKQQHRQQNAKEASKKEGSKKMTDQEDEERSIKLKTGLSFEEFLRMDDDDEELAMGGPMTAAQLLQAQVGGNGNKRRKQGKGGDEENVYISENVDFMDDAAGKHISMKKPEQRGVNMAELDEAANARMRKRVVPMTEGGKLDVTKLNKMMAREEEDTKRIRRQAQNAENPQIALKRKREERAKELQDQQSQRKSGSVGKAYASEKAGGDARKRGQKHDPYAYMPLDPRTLNKRKAGSHTQAATYAAAFSEKKQGKQLGQKMSKSQRHALRKKGGRHGSDE
jgi:ribosomal RNA-processing protein 12